MLVRVLAPCYVERQIHEAGEVFDWRNVNNEPLPACMELAEPVTPEDPETEARRRPGRPRKQG